nr:hypothetical protein HmN_000716400 [Hymenolepis microstoma]
MSEIIEENPNLRKPEMASEGAVTRESQKLLTIKTHCNPYQYTRLPFNAEAKSAIFEKVKGYHMPSLSGDVTNLDRIIVGGRSQQELQEGVTALP